MPDGDYEVGYGKPPKHTRFKPGQSGNPAGRRRKPQTLARDLLDEMEDVVTVEDGDGPRTVSRQRAILRRLTAKAIEGDPKATDMVLGLVQRLIGAGEHELRPNPWALPKPEDRAWLDPPEFSAGMVSAVRRVKPPARWDP